VERPRRQAGPSDLLTLRGKQNFSTTAGSELQSSSFGRQRRAKSIPGELRVGEGDLTLYTSKGRDFNKQQRFNYVQDKVVRAQGPADSLRMGDGSAASDLAASYASTSRNTFTDYAGAAEKAKPLVNKASMKVNFGNLFTIIRLATIRF
jgi:hypothetical protein